jgi:hypothetical protein
MAKKEKEVDGQVEQEEVKKSKRPKGKSRIQ